MPPVRQDQREAGHLRKELLMAIEGFDDALAALAAHDKLKRSQIKQLSGLSSTQVRRLKATWESMPDPERMHLLATLRKTAEDDTLVDFDSVYSMAMDDPNADIRRVAIVSVNESTSESIMERLLELCSHDPEDLVRSAAAERLGSFAYEAEVGTLAGGGGQADRGDTAGAHPIGDRGPPGEGLGPGLCWLLLHGSGPAGDPEGADPFRVASARDPSHRQEHRPRVDSRPDRADGQPGRRGAPGGRGGGRGLRGHRTRPIGVGG